MKQTQLKAPLYEALMKFATKKPISFHVPGHKNGIFITDEGVPYFHSLLEIDVTELSGLDDLHDPSACIEEAEILLAELYGVSRSCLLVNGSTVGNLAMILGTCGKDDVVLVQRNCHKSIMNGLQLAGAYPVFLTATVDEQAYVPIGVEYRTVEQALQQYPQAKAIILTHPNYYGMANNLTKIISLAHEKEIPVLVDEAHGAHFCLGSPFPTSSIEYGADVVVHSAHKTLPAMTMGSYLHINSVLIQEERITSYLSMLQSSSPSYPIMASLDLARLSLARLKEKGTEELIGFLHSIRKRLSCIPQIKVVDYKGQDLLKITIQTRCSLSGYEIQALFEERGIYTELADPYNVLLILPLYRHDAYRAAIDMMQELLHPYPVVTKEKPTYPLFRNTTYSSLSLSYKELETNPTMIYPIINSKDCIAAETIIPYPPGIPLIIKGESITNQHVQQLCLLLEAGARFQGNVYIKEGKILVYDIER